MLLILYVFLIFAAAFFASCETSFVAANAVRLRNMADDGNRRAKMAVKIQENFDKMLTGVLIGNNIAHLGCASIATILAIDIFKTMRPTMGDLESAAAAAASAITTVVVFMLGEMIPKSFASSNSEKVAIAFAPILRAFLFIIAPLAFMFSWISRLMGKLFPQTEEPTVTEEELSNIIDTIEEEGVIDEEQGELLQSALEFSKTTVADVLTMRDDIVFVDLSMTADEIAACLIKNKHSRLPVCDGSIDSVVGILVIRDFLKAYVKGTNVDVRKIMKEPYFVPLNASIDDLLSEMGRNRFYMAIVRDASGNTAGVVTIEDFLEELVGEIFDEDDEIDESFMKLGGNHFEVAGTLSIGEMYRRMKHTPAHRFLPTKPVHIWVLEKLGREPEEEETFEEGELTVTVLEMEDGRVRRIEVKLETPELDISAYETEENSDSNEQEAEQQ